MEKKEKEFQINGIEIGEAQKENVKSLSSGVKRITLKRAIMDFLRKPRVLKIHRVLQDGRTLLVVEVDER